MSRVTDYQVTDYRGLSVFKLIVLVLNRLSKFTSLKLLGEFSTLVPASVCRQYKFFFDFSISVCFIELFQK